MRYFARFTTRLWQTRVLNRKRSSWTGSHLMTMPATHLMLELPTCACLPLPFHLAPCLLTVAMVFGAVLSTRWRCEDSHGV